MRPDSQAGSDDRSPHSRVHALVLAGGRGSRLRHITTALGEPEEKQFCRLGGRRTFLQRTIERLQPLVADERTTVVVRRDQYDIAASQLAAYPEARLIAQPGDRGTGVGVLTALLSTLRSSSAGITILSPADHAFADEEILAAVLEEAIDVARRYRTAVLIGAEADAPRSDFGWIVPEPDPDGGPAFVGRFVEKPPAEQAEMLMRTGGVFNTMLMVVPTAVLFTMFAERCPEVLAEMLPAAFMEGERRRDFLRWAFTQIEPVDFSRDVLARSDSLRLLTLPAEAQWTDLGDETRLLDWLDDRGYRRTAGSIRSLARRRHGRAPRPTRRAPDRPGERNRTSPDLVEAHQR